MNTEQIRLCIYTLCLGGRLLSFVTKYIFKQRLLEFETSYKGACTITCLALLSTACFQLRRDELTLFHSVIVMFLTPILWCEMQVEVLRWYQTRDSQASTVSSIFHGLGLILLQLSPVVFCVYVMAKLKTIATYAYCINDSENGWLGYREGLTERTFLNSVGILVVPWLFFLVRAVVIFWRSRSTTSDCTPRMKDGPRWRIAWRLTDHIISIAISVIYLAQVEILLGRNPVSEEEKEWSFGQTLAMLSLLGPAYRFIQAGLEFWENRKLLRKLGDIGDQHPVWDVDKGGLR
jgi:hypothetical protein